MARKYQSRMTSKGQITVPSELRNELGLMPGDRVEFVRENGSIHLRRAESVVMRTAGSVRGFGRPLERDEIHEIVEKGVAEEVMRRFGHESER